MCRVSFFPYNLYSPLLGIDAYGPVHKDDDYKVNITDIKPRPDDGNNSQSKEPPDGVLGKKTVRSEAPATENGNKTEAGHSEAQGYGGLKEAQFSMRKFVSNIKGEKNDDRTNATGSIDAENSGQRHSAGVPRNESYEQLGIIFKQNHGKPKGWKKQRNERVTIVQIPPTSHHVNPKDGTRRSLTKQVNSRTPNEKRRTDERITDGSDKGEKQLGRRNLAKVTNQDSVRNARFDDVKRLRSAIKSELNNELKKAGYVSTLNQTPAPSDHESKVGSDRNTTNQQGDKMRKNLTVKNDEINPTYLGIRETLNKAISLLRNEDHDVKLRRLFGNHTDSRQRHNEDVLTRQNQNRAKISSNNDYKGEENLMTDKRKEGSLFKTDREPKMLQRLTKLGPNSANKTIVEMANFKKRTTPHSNVQVDVINPYAFDLRKGGQNTGSGFVLIALVGLYFVYAQAASKRQGFFVKFPKNNC